MGRGRVVEMNRDAESFELLRSEVSDLRDELANLKAGLNLYDPLRRLKSDLEGQTDHLGNLTVTREGLSEALGRVLAGKSLRASRNSASVRAAGPATRVS